MKKLVISLLFSISIFINTYGDLTPITTNLGPLQLITPNGLNIFAAGSVNIFGKIKIGNSPTDKVTIQAAGITYPTLNKYTILVIDNSGNILTANNTYPVSCGPLTASSITTSGKVIASDILCQNLNAANDIGENIILGNSAGNINLKSAQIIYPVSNQYALLMIDSNGNLNTATPYSTITCGEITTNNLSATNFIDCDSINTNIINNTNTLTCGTLTAANNNGQSITLGNKTGNIKLISAYIINPLLENYNILTIDSNGNINSADSSTTIAIGTINASNINTTNSISCDSLTTNYLNASDGIRCGSFTAAPNIGQSVILGNTTGSIKIIASNILKPSSGTSPLYINSNGMITTINSSQIYKKNIQPLEISENAFNVINPVSFYYINDDISGLRYGLIAEELLQIPTLKESVIFGDDGKPLSIDYAAVSIALIADYKKTKKEIQLLKEQIELILAMIENKIPK
jgi:hypothetical protein